METARIAETIDGSKLYQRRAREALPLLVRQAEASAPMYYSDLASEMGMPNPRNLNYVLGSVGQTLQDLSAQLNVEIPPIQCLVLNRSSHLPGNGISWLITSKEDFATLPRRKQREVVKTELAKVFAFARWREVLAALQLKPAPVSYKSLLVKAVNIPGGGESEAHRQFKELVSKHPEWLKLPASVKAAIESPLLSGDCLDVLFVHGEDWIAAEVKSHISSEADVVRGLFQCVKYRAVLEASQAAQGLPQSSRAVLVLESAFPQSLIPLKNVLAVEVVTPKLVT